MLGFFELRVFEFPNFSNIFKGLSLEYPQFFEFCDDMHDVGVWDYLLYNTMEVEKGQTKISQNHIFFIEFHNL